MSLIRPCRLCAAIAMPLLFSLNVALAHDNAPAEENRAIDVNQPQQDEKPIVYRAVVKPAAEPTPALKYRLYPSRVEMQPGNSVPYYYRVILHYVMKPQETRTKLNELQEKISNHPLATLSDLNQNGEFEIARQFDYQINKELHRACYRESTNWDWQLNQLEGTEIIEILLTEIQEARSLARLIEVRARIAVSEGRHDDAFHDLLLLFKTSRDIAEPPLLINGLVGIAMASIGCDVVLDTILETDCPNLYWALAALPDPLIDLLNATEQESGLIEIMFPDLKDPKNVEHSSAEWARLMRSSFNTIVALESRPNDGPFQDLTSAALLVRGYPMARRELLAGGMTEKEVDQLSVGQAIAIVQSQTSKYIFDECFKWAYLPFPEGYARYRQTEQRLAQEGYLGPGLRREIMPLAALLVPAVGQVRVAQVRLQSRIKGLMVLEAIRMYAADHDGKLPKTLDDITQVPLPICPLNNKPYDYRWDGNEAVLTVPTDPRLKQVWWEIRLKEK